MERQSIENMVSCFALLVDEARVPFVYHCFEVGANNPCFVATVLNVPQIDYQLRKLVSSGARMDGLLNICRKFQAQSKSDFMEQNVEEAILNHLYCRYNAVGWEMLRKMYV